jgi:hypothetical protein
MTRRVILANLLVPIAAWVIWDQYETRALARQIAALAARGEPTSATVLPSGAETPEQHLAARVYAAAAEHAGRMPPESTFRLPRIDVDSVTVVESRDRLERAYPHDAPPLQLIDQAAPLAFTGFGELTGEVDPNALVTVAYLGLLRADLSSARGDVDTAAASIASVMGLARALETRTRISVRALGSFRILLRRGTPSREALVSLQRAYAALPDRDDLLADVRARRARFLDAIAAPRPTLTEAGVRRAMRPWIARSNRQQLAVYDEVQALAAGSWPDKLLVSTERMARERYGNASRTARRGFIARQTLPPGAAYVNFPVGQAGSELAARRVATAAIAIERFRADRRGTPPASLDALVPGYLTAVPIDPFTGRPLVYTVSGTEYRIYSVDTDLKDDRGAIYGVGSRAQLQPRQGQPRDLGLRVEYRRVDTI